ncbi:MAG: hypothetical protein EBZ49_00815 [Proteobacteria bacterium]|nr:hypothetical protein [Pseudomonadota bacterium]
MAVKKVNGFSAPYRSATFQAESNSLVGRNGVIAMSGTVSSSGGVVTIPAFTAIQQGLIYSKDTATTLNIPPTLTAPYYVTVTAPTPINTDDLIFSFARTPNDITNTEVILGEWDGVEWRNLDKVSIDGTILDKESDHVNLSFVGPRSGLITSVVGGNYRNTPGFLVDKKGHSTELSSNAILPIPPNDVDFERVDRIIYRRPSDSVNRIGTRRFQLGCAYTSGDPTLYDTVLTSTTLVNQNPKVLVDSINSAHMFYAQGYGASFSIMYQKYAANRTTNLVAPLSIVTATTPNFSVAIDSSNNLYVVYIQDQNVKWVKTNNEGLILAGPITIDSRTTPCDNPQIVIDPQNFKTYIVYQSLLNPSNNQLFFTTRSLTGAQITPDVRLTNNSSNLINPSICINDDLMLYVAYEDNTAGQIYYTVLNDVGEELEAPQSISGSTSSESFGTLSHQASKPTIQVADNRELFVMFLQKKSANLTGVSIYHEGAAYQVNLLSQSENILNYAARVDSLMNDIHISYVQASRVDYAIVEAGAKVQNWQLSTSGGFSIALAKDTCGANVHVWSSPLAGTYSPIGALQTIRHIGPVAIAGVLNPLVLGANEFSLLVAGLTYTPVVGDQVTIAGSTKGNNGAKVVTRVTLKSILTPNDTYVVQVDSSFAAVESPCVAVVGQFAQPNGNSTSFVKSVANTNEARALRTEELSTDIILSRLSVPGPIILNYIPITGFGTNSDLFGMYGNINVDWSATMANALTMSAGLSIVDLTKNLIYTVTGGTFPMNEGDAIYVVLNGVNTTISPQVCPIQNLPYDQPIQVLGFVKLTEFNPHLFSVAGMGNLDVGEAIVLGQDLTTVLRARLGITGESTYQPYTSTTQISAGDNYPSAISKLDQALYTIMTDLPKEEYVLVTDPGGQTVFQAPTITWNSSNLIQDVEVYVNGLRQTLDTAGGNNEDFYKISDTQIQFSKVIPKNARVTFRTERTGGGVSGINAIDLTNITVNPQPLLNGTFGVGSSSKGWNSLYLTDVITGTIYKLIMSNGVLQVVPA